jgi:hypothetical protein
MVNFVSVSQAFQVGTEFYTYTLNKNGYNSINVMLYINNDNKGQVLNNNNEVATQSLTLNNGDVIRFEVVAGSSFMTSDYVLDATFTVGGQEYTSYTIGSSGSAPAPAPAPAPASAAIQPKAIEVNFNTVIDACGNITVFGVSGPTVANVIVAEYKLPVSCLYTKNSSGQDVSGLIEFWEPSDNLGDLNCKLAENIQGVSGDYYKDTAKVFATEMHRMFCDAFDCSAATPFDGYKSQNQEYWMHRDFGRLALSAHAHDLFGHVAATAAITNDAAFMQNMLSLNATTGVLAAGLSGERFSTWSKDVTLPLTDAAWDANSATDANLALRMVKAIVKKGLDAQGAVKTETGVYASTDASGLSNIVKQVLGQDASRAMDVDNNELQQDRHQLLRFYANDTIYVNVKLQKPNVTYGAGQRTPAPFQDGDAERNYTIKITLA